MSQLRLHKTLRIVLRPRMHFRHHMHLRLLMHPPNQSLRQRSLPLSLIINTSAGTHTFRFFSSQSRLTLASNHMNDRACVRDWKVL